MYQRKSDRPFASKTQGRSLSDYCVVKTYDITAKVSSRTPARRNSRRTHRQATDPIVDLRDSQRSRKYHQPAARFGFCRSWWMESAFTVPDCRWSNADFNPLLERIIFQGDRPFLSKVRSPLNYQKHLFKCDRNFPPHTPLNLPVGSLVLCTKHQELFHQFLSAGGGFWF